MRMEEVTIYGHCGQLKAVTVKLITMDVDSLELDDTFTLPDEMQDVVQSVVDIIRKKMYP